MNAAALASGLFSLAALAALFRFGYQPLFGYLLVLSLVATAVFAGTGRAADAGDKEI